MVRCRELTLRASSGTGRYLMIATVVLSALRRLPAITDEAKQARASASRLRPCVTPTPGRASTVMGTKFPFTAAAPTGASGHRGPQPHSKKRCGGLRRSLRRLLQQNPPGPDAGTAANHVDGLPSCLAAVTWTSDEVISWVAAAAASNMPDSTDAARMYRRAKPEQSISHRVQS